MLASDAALKNFEKPVATVLKSATERVSRALKKMFETQRSLSKYISKIIRILKYWFEVRVRRMRSMEQAREQAALMQKASMSTIKQRLRWVIAEDYSKAFFRKRKVDGRNAP